MTEPSYPLVEVAVHVPANQSEVAQYVVGEFSPGGFQFDNDISGSLDVCRIAVFLPAGDEQRFTSWLASGGVEIVGEVEVTAVPSDWSERWKEFHRPVNIGELWVGPPWQIEEAPARSKRIVIEPAQGFGTGAHATTRLMLTLLQQQPRASVLDLGCGSGVLAIAAAKLGFGPIFAVDNDPVAITSTRENLVRNDCESLVNARILDALSEDIPAADIVLANILFEPLVRIAPKINAPRVVLSGLLKSQVADCAVAYEKVGYSLREQRDRDGWSALVLENVNEHRQAMQHRPIW